MTTRTQHLFKALIFALFLVIVSTPAQAGNPLYMNPDNTPVVWDSSETIKYKVDPKGLGRLSYTESVVLIGQAMSIWEAVDGTGIEFEYAGAVSEAITIDNWQEIAANTIYAEGNGIIPVTATDSQLEHYLVIGFDNTGDIITAKGSSGASGLHSLTGVSGTLEEPGNIISAHIFLSGLYINGTNDDIGDITTIDMMAIIVHELGHALGLDHSIINYSIYENIMSGETGLSSARYLPVMFPRFVKGTGEYLYSLNPDDIATLQWLYGVRDTSFSGAVTDSNHSPVSTLVVTARHTASPLCQAFAQASGAACNDVMTSTGSLGRPYFTGKYCMDENQQGAYSITTLKEGAYTLDVQGVPDLVATSLSRFSVMESINGNAEFFNVSDAALESAYISDEVVVSAVNQNDLDFILSGADGTDLERIPTSYFEESFDILEDDEDCPAAAEFDIDTILATTTVDEITADDSTSDTSSSESSTSTSETAPGCALNSRYDRSAASLALLFLPVMLLLSKRIHSA